MALNTRIPEVSQSISDTLTQDLQDPKEVRREEQGEIAAYLRNKIEHERRLLTSRLKEGEKLDPVVESLFTLLEETFEELASEIEFGRYTKS